MIFAFSLIFCKSPVYIGLQGLRVGRELSGLRDKRLQQYPAFPQSKAGQESRLSRQPWQETNTEQRSARVRDFDPLREKARVTHRRKRTPKCLGCPP